MMFDSPAINITKKLENTYKPDFTKFKRQAELTKFDQSDDFLTFDEPDFGTKRTR